MLVYTGQSTGCTGPVGDGRLTRRLHNEYADDEYINQDGFNLAIAVFCQCQCGTINFSGQLGVVAFDNGLGVYSSAPIGTTFSGTIDDVTANGNITDGVTFTPFGCCIAAGGLSVSNDQVLSADDAALLNALAGSPLCNAGDLVDGIDIEGDAVTAGGGRIDVGLSYLFDAGTFSDDLPGNYPFDPAAVVMRLFFIFEEDMNGADMYSAAGRMEAVPLPSAAVLFATGSVFLWAACRRRVM